MKFNKLKALSIAICCLVTALWSESKCAEDLTWEGDKVVANVGISGSPSLAVFKNRLYCAYNWSDGSNQLAWTSASK